MTFLHIMSKIVGELKRNNYNMELGADGLTYVIRGNVVFGTTQYACDTVISEDVKQPDGAPAAIFSTYIYSGLSGEKMQYFTQLVGLMNYRYLGKFVNDFTDGSQDLIYVTRERLDKLSQQVIDKHLIHHAQVKSQVAPALEAISSELGLQPKLPDSKDPEFQSLAGQFMRVIRAHSSETIKYVPARPPLNPV